MTTGSAGVGRYGKLSIATDADSHDRPLWGIQIAVGLCHMPRLWSQVPYPQLAFLEADQEFGRCTLLSSRLAKLGLWSARVSVDRCSDGLTSTA